MNVFRSRSGGRRPGPAIAGACLAALAVAACGGSGHATTHAASTHTSSSASITPCQSEARAAIAHFLAITPGSIAASPSMGTNGMPQCTFSAEVAPRVRMQTVANVDNGPQPYFRLERTEVEASQVFTPTRLTPAPESISALGLEADWFPAYPQLMATDGIRLITVSVDWRTASQNRERTLAEAIARTYLRTPHGKAAERLVDGYPSG